MKKIICLLLVITMGASSCSDYLTVTPSDAKFLVDVQSLKQTLAAWLLNYRDNSSYVGTDAPYPWIRTAHDPKFAAYSDVYNFWLLDREPFLFEIEKRWLGRVIIDYPEWDYHYGIIGLMNLILAEVDDAEGDDDMRNYVKGEALIHRAVSFFKLLQYYAPINDPDLGIPVYTEIYESFLDADLSRKKQSVAFDRIFSDLDEAERLLGITQPRSSYNIVYNYDHIYRIKAQVYHWKASGPVAEPEDWTLAAAAASNAIAATGNLLPYDVEKLASPDFFGTGGRETPPDGYPEALFFTADVAGAGSYPEFGYDLNLWKTLYHNNDNRKFIWFGLTPGTDPDMVSQTSLMVSSKIRGFGWNKPQFHYRLSEQYLILIEACGHTDFARGKEVLRLWQSVRYSGPESGWFVPSNSEQLLEEVYRERKREFVLEGDLHWLDMKRMRASDGPRNISDYSAPALTPDDFRYNFMIPDSETDTNPGIVRNPGWEDYRVI